MQDIEFFNDIFEPQFCRWLLEDARMALTKGSEYSRSNHQWPAEIVRTSQPVLVRDYQTRIAEFIVARLKDRGVVDSLDFMVMNYAWSRLSYIPWHDDGHRKTAITVYLNEVWDKDWGGLFLYQTSPDGEIKAHAPRFNCGLRNSHHLQHATTMVTMDAPEPRFTLQIFSRE